MGPLCEKPGWEHGNSESRKGLVYSRRLIFGSRVCQTIACIHLRFAVNYSHLALLSIHSSCQTLDTPLSNREYLHFHNKRVHRSKGKGRIERMASTSTEAEKNTPDTSPPPELEKAPVAGNNAPINPTNADDSTLAILELVKAQDAHHPIHWPAWKRWSIITVYCFLQLFVTMTSTSYSTSDSCRSIAKK